jgi:hypothetical protein
MPAIFQKVSLFIGIALFFGLPMAFATDRDLAALNDNPKKAAKPGNIPAKTDAYPDKGALPSARRPEAETRPPANFTESTDKDTGWKILTNETLGFALRIPTACQMVEQKVHAGLGGEDVRFVCERESKANLIIDMILRNRKEKQLWTERCPGTMRKIRTRLSKGFVIYTGLMEEDDPAYSERWWTLELCGESDRCSVLITAGESDHRTPIAKKVLQSFRFISGVTRH